MDLFENSISVFPTKQWMSERLFRINESMYPHSWQTWDISSHKEIEKLIREKKVTREEAEKGGCWCWCKGENTMVHRGKMGCDRSREEMPRSELCMWVAVVSAACWALTGFHKDAFHGFPQAVLAGARHGMNLCLTVDRSAILLPCYWQQRISGFVAEANGLFTLPNGTPT